MANQLTKVLNYLGLKKAPNYGNPSNWTSGRFNWGWNRSWFNEIDYASELGDLDGCYLIMAVINWTATQLPEAPPVVQKPGKKSGTFEPEWGHPCAELIRRPTPFDVWGNDCGALSLSWWIDGNAYWMKARNTVTGQVQELWYLPHFMVDERWPGDGKTPEVPTSGPNKALNTFLSHYQYNVPGKEPELIRQDNVLHIKRGKNPANPRRGVGAFDSAVEELYGDKMMSRFSATVMKNMGIVVPLLTPKDSSTTISETQAAAIEEKWVQKTTGVNTGKPIINSIPLDVTKFAWSPEELDLSRLRLNAQTVVSSLSNIPAAVLGFMVGLEHGHYGATWEQAREQAYESVVIPIQSSIAEQISWQLLPEFDQTPGARLVFDTSNVRVLQADRDKEYERVRQALGAGAITINQFLRSLDKEGVPEGDVYLIPGMSTPMTAERLLATAEGETARPEVDPNIQELGKLADLDRYLQLLEKSMKDFQLPK